MSGHKPEDYGHLAALLVDDNVVNQKVTQAMLNHFNIEPRVAENGKIALDMAKNEQFDLIFMDCQMPVMGGYEATQAIRDKKNDNTFMTDNEVVIIAMTANASPDDIKACYESGMSDFIAKPVELDTIRKVLEKWYGCA